MPDEVLDLLVAPHQGDVCPDDTLRGPGGVWCTVYIETYTVVTLQYSTVHYPISKSDVLDFNSSSTSHFTKCIF